ncbi:MAG: porin [Flavisolibacter sp.]|jgi:hypothetical protein
MKTGLVVCKALLWIILLTELPAKAFSQRYLADYDSTLFIKDTLRPFVNRFNNLNFSGYIQPQFQVAQQKGAASYASGNFSDFSDSRFMLRRARLKMDYVLPSRNKVAPKALFTFQFDATERGVFVRDMFLRLYEPKREKFSLTMGLVARPFGYEVNLSSAYRETPERGRMSQILMPTERDLGAMLSYESAVKNNEKLKIKFDVGAFNGQGLVGTTDFDSYKDLISRFSLRPYAFGKNFFLSGGISLLYGGWMQTTKYKYQTATLAGNKLFVVDSAEANAGSKAPRHYYGADIQLACKHAWGKTELRGEYWSGKQPGTVTSTTNPGALPLTPTYIRKFDGAFFYLLQNIVNHNWELMVKYDWYDPNREVAKLEIGKPGTNFTSADIKYTTLGVGLTRYFTESLKILAYYDMVKNEETALTGFSADVRDNIFTLRMQLRF